MELQHVGGQITKIVKNMEAFKCLENCHWDFSHKYKSTNI